MAEIFPFAAYRYSPARVRLENVLTQPYDKITPAMQERYSAASPYNLITIEKGRSTPADTSFDNVYTRAARAFSEWVVHGVVVRDPTPNIYIYSQDFKVPGTSLGKVRNGFIALARLEDYSAGVVHRHELTHTGPKADRLELLRHTRVQTGQLFMLYSDPARRVDALLDEQSRSAAEVEARDEFGVVHRLWRLSEPARVAQIVAAMAPQKLVIADGHHRYETALAYRDECRRTRGKARNAAHEMAMMTFVNAHAEGVTILPTHRLVCGLPFFQPQAFLEKAGAWFETRDFSFAEQADRSSAYARFRAALEGASGGTIGLYAGAGAFHLLSLRKTADLASALPELSPAVRRLDVVMLHKLLLERVLGITAEALVAEKHVSYEREMDAAIARVDGGIAQLACLLNPVRVEQVVELALAGETMPQKSTDFYPKLLSGLAMYRLED